MANLRSEKRGEFYWKDGKPYLSVTTVLKVLDKPALRRWYGDQVFNAVILNPSISREEAHSSVWKTTESAKDRGSTVHSIVEAYKHTKEHIESIPEQFRGYGTAFYRFVTDYKPEILEHERSVFSEQYQYAGTLDLLMKIGESKPIVTDVKTGKDIYPEAFLQTAAYHQALTEEGQEVDGIAVLLLQEDGSYKFELNNSWQRKLDGFLAAKTLYEAINEETLNKLGYFQKQNGSPIVLPN